MNIILLGPPGSGKGTQSEKLSEDYGLPHISTGNILRHAIENETKLGVKAKQYMDEGDLVPDELVDEIVKERLSFRDCNKGFILDGFPRDIEQALDLESIRGIDYVFQIKCPDDVIVDRLSNRRICPKCQETYHLKYDPPSKEKVCDECGSDLIQRDDDKPETIKKRLKVYHQQTEPLIEYYNKENLLHRIDGEKKPDEIYGEIKSRLEP